ncbi:helix-turn-helix domain-containing protein [Flavobacterium lacustre]|uniref:helix-turn-helix domain-containing protein n=1 Tax=Flavobacterium lacustre TaxID=3016339 RepID=UPI0022B6F7F9|nr:helix-turn-helix domain-containing protein [Flavobacterium lacustre]
MRYLENESEPIIKLLEEIKSKFDTIRQPKKYYRNSDLKELFGLSDNTILTYRDKNILPFSKMGEIYYYPIAEIENLLSKNSNFDLFGNRY